MSYSDKLKDPRWQKKRLEIFERDNWTCQSCKCTDETLMVHHFFYEHNKEPWEYDLDDLMTLCQTCHKYEHESREIMEKQLLRVLKIKKFLSDDLLNIACGFANIDNCLFEPISSKFLPNIYSQVFEFSCRNNEIQKQMIDNLAIFITEKQREKLKINIPIDQAVIM